MSKVDGRSYGHGERNPATLPGATSGSESVDENKRKRFEEVTEALTVAIERSRAARAVDLEKPELCGAKAIGTECVRPVHPTWEQHEDWLGHTWFAGEAPR